MILLSTITFCFLFSLTIQAQTIQVLDEETKTPVIGVAIFNESKLTTGITDVDGNIDITNFSENEKITFQHISHINRFLTKKEIISSGNTIFLSPDASSLDEVVLSISKFEQNKKEIPQKISSITSKDVLFTNPQTSADLLERSGNVFIQKSQLGGGSPIIRGFSTNRLLIAVDGTRFNNAIFRGGNVQNVISIDPLSIKNVEVTLGSGSIIYGSDAIGGVMSFYTQKPKLSYTDSLKVSANAMVRYATASNEKMGHLDFNIGLKEWAFLTNASYTSFDDLRMGNHGPADYLRNQLVSRINEEDVMIENPHPLIQRYSGYNQFNFMQKVRFEPYNSLSFDLGLYYTTTSDVPRYDRLIRYKGANLRSAEWYYGPQQWFMANAQITKLSSLSNLYDKLKVTMAYQNFQESRVDRDFQSDIRNIREEAVDAYSFNLDLEKKLSNKTHFFYGLEYVYNKVMSYGVEENISVNTSMPTVSRYPNGADWQSAAVYSSIKYKPNPKFIFQTGLRFNQIIANADFTENNVFLNLPFNKAKIDAGAFTGTAGISWIPNETMTWKFNASSAFRAPNMDDIGKVFDSEPGSVVVPNNNLKPEYAYNFETSVLKYFNNRKFHTGINIYYTLLNNYITRDYFEVNNSPTIMYDGEEGTVVANVNKDNAYIVGSTFSFKGNINNTWHSKGSLTYTKGKTYDTKLPLSSIPPLFGNLEIGFEKERFQANLNWKFNAKKRLEDYNLIEGIDNLEQTPYNSITDSYFGNPKWNTFSVNANYKLSNSFTIFLNVDNILDTHYKEFASSISAPGRNLSVTFLLKV